MSGQVIIPWEVDAVATVGICIMLGCLDPFYTFVSLGACTWPHNTWSIGVHLSACLPACPPVAGIYSKVTFKHILKQTAFAPVYQINIAPNLCVCTMTCNVNAIEKNPGSRDSQQQCQMHQLSQAWTHSQSFWQAIPWAGQYRQTGRLMQTDQTKPTHSRQPWLYDRRQWDNSPFVTGLLVLKQSFPGAMRMRTHPSI